MNKIKKYLFPLLASAAVLLPMMFTHSCANTTQAPSGGKKDTIPPVIVNIEPLPGEKGFPLTGGSIVFTFNEYVKLKNNPNVFLSPPTKNKPASRIKGKSVVVSFPDTLSPGTTYTLNLNDAVQDNNEGNQFPGFTYVFSTGEEIDSMFITGTVLDCSTLSPVKGAKVLLYKNHADSAVFLERPAAAAITDDWGYFSVPYIQDTLYRLYAIKDAGGNNIYDPSEDLVGFIDSLIRPVLVASDTVPELMKYDMTDTLGCEARRVEYTINLFQEKPEKQFLKNKGRTGLRSAFVSFQAPYVWIDSLWFGGYRADEVISQFNITQDSLELWLNSRSQVPDTLHLFVNYRKTDSVGILRPELEHLRLPLDSKLKQKYSRRNARNLEHKDTTCIFHLDASPERVEQYGFELEFDSPIIFENFDSLGFRYRNPKEQEFKGAVTVERDTANLRRYTIRPSEKMLPGYVYYLKVPDRAFRDINGFYSDSAEVKVSLPSDDELSTLSLVLSGVGSKYIIDFMDEKMAKVLRSYIVESDATLAFPYLKAGRYCIRITSDDNRNSVVDTGNLLAHRQPELVKFVDFKGSKFMEVPKASDIEQKVDLAEMFER